MTSSEYESFSEQILGAYRPDESPDQALVIADYFLEHGDLKLAASALDRAWGLSPREDSIAARRKDVLDQLEVIDRGLRFRYVPAGSFLMGSDRGDHDERPVHAVRLGGFWIAEVPTTWSTFADLNNWTPPPTSSPRGIPRQEIFGAYAGGDLRSLYSRTWTGIQSREYRENVKMQREFEQKYCRVRATVDEAFSANRSIEFDVKPMVAVAMDDASEMCAAISNSKFEFRLPSEPEWEKAARGGLIGKKFGWGDSPPATEFCDFNHFGAREIMAPKLTRPNAYGLYGMCGGVWEWTQDEYDSRAYRHALEATESTQKEPGFLGKLATRAISMTQSRRARQRVLRGGSWVDCAEAVTVSFRMSRDSVGWKSEEYDRRTHITPTIGFRICRLEIDESND